MKSWIAVLLIVPIAALFAGNVVGQEMVYRSGLDDETGWTIIADDDTEYEFGFDYTRYGIPPAPNGADGLGLRVAANITDPRGLAVISATPDGVELSGQYTLQVDMWINYNTAGGTTEFIGGFVGYDPSVAVPRSGAGFLGDSDGDSSRDFRLYRDDAELLIDSGQYALSSNNNTDPVLKSHFLGQTTPEMQTNPAMFDPPNDMVRAPDGTLGYAWHELSGLDVCRRSDVGLEPTGVQFRCLRQSGRFGSSRTHDIVARVLCSCGYAIGAIAICG